MCRTAVVFRLRIGFYYIFDLVLKAGLFSFLGYEGLEEVEGVLG